MSKSDAKVGRSTGRTPAKHELLNMILGKMVGVLSLNSTNVPCSVSADRPFVMVDLCGGDGLKTDDHDASPVIMYKHASWLSNRGMPVQMEVIEKAALTFEQLEKNCGYMSKDIIRLTLGDSREYRLPFLKETQSAFIHCDPNNVDQTPLTGPFVAGFNKYTTYLVTLGCNVSGIKRTTADKRSKWFEYVEMLVDSLPRHHDAILFWLNRDASQWAYLLNLPRVWTGDFVASAIDRLGKFWPDGVSAISFRHDRIAFDDQLARLFLTKDEYEQL